ncbi:MAG: hypothetical protein H8E84_02265 [Flavobacteriales bacterium]|nr:hypothetical protein [Flavobacteriales bacterium]
MKAKQIALILIPLNIILAYFVYNSINSEVEFQKVAKIRIAENVQNLKDLRAVQIAYKNKHQEFADNFDSLLYFLNFDSIAVVKSEGEAPDTLTELQAVKAGLISRDTIFIDAKSHIFSEDYLGTRNQGIPFVMEALQYIPHTKNKMYGIDAGNIEKGKVIVQVFEVFAKYSDVLIGLDAENKKYDLQSQIKVGSMSEASLNGNWGE